MIDAVDQMVSREATILRQAIEARQAVLAALRERIISEEAELSVLRGKLADIAGTAPIPPDVKVII